MSESTNAISGFAVRYNEPTVIGGVFREVISPGAFAKSRDDVVLLHGHDANRPLARTTSGTLSLRDSTAGLYFNATLDPENPDAALVLSAVGRRDIQGMSFGFLVRQEEWREPDNGVGLPTRIVLDAALLELSTVTWPAYPQADVALSQQGNAAAAMRRVREKAERQQRLRGLR